MDRYVPDVFELRWEVRQGSCLGPLLFTHLPKAYVYADDTQQHISFNPNNNTDQEAAITGNKLYGVLLSYDYG